ncbi:MAG: DNA pilot protein [Microvirus sp.]|nr:MAG: DNA pilot protein [Microvirus sp.]
MDPATMIAAGSAVAGLFGGGGMSPRKQMAAQYDYQRRLNQSAIQDRVADAEKAGIHPLYALGASLNPGGVSMPDQGSGNRLGDRLSNMGQNISRAVMAKQSQEERGLAVQSAKLDLEGKSLQNQILRSQLINAQSQLGPGIDGTGKSDGSVNYISNTLVGPGRDGREPGPLSGHNLVLNADGSSTRVPSKDWQDRSEDVPLLGWEWLYRNRVMPFIQDSGSKIYNNLKKSSKPFKGRSMRTGPQG